MAVQYGARPEALRLFGQLRIELAARSVTPVGLAAIYRYRPAAEVRGDLDELAAATLVDIAGDGTVRATENGHGLLAEMYAIGADALGALWAERATTLPGLNDLIGRVVTAGLQTGGPAYTAMAPPHEPADTPVGLLLHHRLSVLRYHRADAHAAAWQAAGLTSVTIREMTPGPTSDAIEVETNRRAGQPYAALLHDERVTLLAGLAALPG
jgi:hypothetical protein